MKLKESLWSNKKYLLNPGIYFTADENPVKPQLGGYLTEALSSWAVVKNV
jgi:hypothetical protein